ncbi:MAG TPA: hypothetical protein VGA30_06665 [Actinomycetota bacterium]
MARRNTSTLVALIALTASLALTARGAMASPACVPGWHVVPSPSPGDLGSQLSGVAAISSTDAWAVGVAGGSPSRTLIEHWDGAEWSVVPSVDVGTLNSLSGVTALSSSDVWAVGQTFVTDYAPLIEHWDGSMWSLVPSDPTVPSGGLSGISGTGPADIWAVGGTGTSSLIEHWDGHGWSRVDSPTGKNTGLLSVQAIAPDDAWAVGNDIRGFDETAPVIEHWDGRAWSRVRSAQTSRPKVLEAVWADSASDAWAVGSVGPGIQTHAERWDGSTWTTTYTPSPGSDAVLRGVGGSSADDVWAVGNVQGGAIAERWNGRRWKDWPIDGNYWLSGVEVEPTGDAWAVGANLDSLLETHVVRFIGCSA